MTSSHAPELDGVHHLKLPVSDLNRSRAWYESRLGFARRLTALGEQHAGVHFATSHPAAWLVIEGLGSRAKTTGELLPYAAVDAFS